MSYTKDMNGPGHLKDMEAMIREYDARLVECGRRVACLSDHGAKWLTIDAEIGFMDTLQAHRRAVLSEYRRAGGSVKDLYTFGAHVIEGEVTGA